jgi:hypothetical protein
VNAAIVGMEEIAAVRDRVMMRRTNGATSPAPATRSSPTAAVFASFLAEFDAVLHFVLDAGKPRGHQTSTSLQLFFGHNVLRCNNLAKGFAIPQEPSWQAIALNPLNLFAPSIPQLAKPVYGTSGP